MIRALPFFFLFFFGRAYSLDVRYHVGLELKPISMLVSPIEGGRGIAGAAEIGEVASTFITLFGESSSASNDDNDLGIDCWAIGVGLRTYSYYRTDSLYIGAEVRKVNIDFVKSKDSDPWLRHQYRQVKLESGFRWLWENGFMLRTGLEASRYIQSRPQPEGERQESYTLHEMNQLEAPLNKEKFRASRHWLLAADLGFGFVF